MGAIIDGIELGAMTSQKLDQALVEVQNMRLEIIAPSRASLIGSQNAGYTGFIHKPHRITGAFNQVQVIQVSNIARLYIESTVSIKKDNGFFGKGQGSSNKFRQRLRE